MDSSNPDNYLLRAALYGKLENWGLAIKDISRVLESDNYSKDGGVYYLRAYFYASSKNWPKANEDLKIAYKYADDPSLEKVISDLYDAIP